MLLLCASVETFVYSVCACSRTLGASSRELGERHALCDIPLSLLRQLRLLRVFLRTAAAAAAAAVCCHRFVNVGLPEAAKNHYEIKWIIGYSARFWTCRARVGIWGSSFSLFLCLKPIRFVFHFSDLVIMYRFTAVSHVLHDSNTINNALFTAVARQMSGFEPSLPCSFFLFFSFFFGWVSGIMDA